MSAYLIVEIEVHDPDTYEDYKSQVQPTLDAFGGAFCVRGGAADLLEGDTAPGRIVVVRFPSVAVAKEWYDSAQYAGPKALRQSASTARMLLVEGCDRP